MELLIAVFSGFALAAIAPFLHRLMGEPVAFLLALLPLGITIYFGLMLGMPVAEQVTAVRYAWAPGLDLSLSFYLDGLSLLFVLIIAGVGALVVVYTGGYMAGRRRAGSLHAYLLSFMAAMLGLVLAGNILTLYVFWELTTITSFLLIGFEHEREPARRAALQGLLTTALGGLSLLAGLVLLGIVAQTFEFTELLSRGDAVREHDLYPLILGLVLMGAFTKSAQFPFHFWLPNAMEAPTPVSAYLHSAAMVKAGVYLLARLLPVLGGTGEWHLAVTAVGALTMIAGAYLAYFRHELKAVLAYLTVSVLGTLVMLLGIGSELAVSAALAYMLAHTLYKGALFMLAGAVDHAAHTMDIRQLGGLWRWMPVTCGMAVLAALSMAGVIPLFGFVAKELYLEAAWKAPSAAVVLTVVSVVSSALLVAGAGMVGVSPFFGSRGKRVANVHEASAWLLLSPSLLAVGGLVMGVFPQQLGQPLIQPALRSVVDASASVDLALWHGLSVPFLLSVAAILTGALVYVLREPLLRRVPDVRALTRWGPEAWYARTLLIVRWLAKRQTQLLQSGHLRLYVLTVLATTVAIVGPMLGNLGFSHLWQPSMGVRFHEGVAAAVIAAAAWTAVTSRERYRSIASLGVIGLSMSWIYVIFGGPDLAMTQIVVEALTVLLFVLAFQGLPNFRNVSGTKRRLTDAALAGSIGLMITLLLLSVTGFSGPAPISEYFAEQSYERAHGRNVVNVILVDFRALDTLGETTVLATAAVGVHALLRLVSGARVKQ